LGVDVLEVGNEKLLPAECERENGQHRQFVECAMDAPIRIELELILRSFETLASFLQLLVLEFYL
jgi:hypothetical protein